MKKYKRQPVKASTKPAPKRAIKASEDSDEPVVFYWEAKKIFEGDISDIYETILGLCQDNRVNQGFQEWCNSFGDPFEFDGTPEDTAQTVAWLLEGIYNDSPKDFYEDFGETDKPVFDDPAEIFLKSEEIVEGSVQRRAKKSVKASNNNRGDNAMKMCRGKRNVNASTGRPADEFYAEIHRKLDAFCSDILRTYYESFGITEESPAISETVAYDNAIDNMTDAIVGYLNVQIEDQTAGEIEESVRTVKASTYGDAFEDIERSKDAYIQRWSEEYEGTPATSWDNIFDNVLEEFTRYADDEASGFILEKFENGEYTAEDMDNEFEQYIMWLDLNEYDHDYYA